MTLIFSFLFFGLLTSCTTTPTNNSCEEVPTIYGPADFQVKVFNFENSQNASKSLIIMPPTGGPTYLERGYAKKFCAAGYNVYLFNSWTGDTDESVDLEKHQRIYASAQKAIATVIKQIKSPFIGILGTSLGALHTSVAVATQEKINAAFLIAGGGPIPEVIVTSDQKAMRDLRDARIQRYGFKSDTEYIAALDKVFLLDPTKQGDLYKKKDIGMVVAEDDTTVPYSNQLKLQTFFNPKKTYTLNSSHFWGIVKTWYFHSQEVLDFFEDSERRFHAN